MTALDYIMAGAVVIFIGEVAIVLYTSRNRKDYHWHGCHHCQA